jgi:alkanesulfonate monooxygenase SsuD/methylene tetrahydromethanopterin reductase-like flavin-dependent oxidoreductase (luciferase family)
MPWRPLQRPHPPIWIPTGTPQHAKEAGAKGYGNGGFALLGKDLYRQVFDAYREGWKSSNRPTADQRIAWLTSVVVADTDAEARALAYEHFPKQIARFEYEASRTYSLVDSVRRKRVDRSFDLFKRLTSDLEGAERNLAFICGGPDTVAEKIQHLQEDMGVNVFMGEYSFGELEYEHVARSLRLMAEQVMPRFKRPSSPRPAGAAR